MGIFTIAACRNFHHCRLPSPSALSQIHSTSQAQTGSDDGLGSNCCNQALALRTGSMHYEKAPLLQKVAVVMGGVTTVVYAVGRTAEVT